MKFVATVTLCLLTVSCRSFEYKTVEEGSTRRSVAVLRNIDDIFPMYAITNDIDISLKPGADGSFDADVAANLKQQFNQLYDRLDNLNAQVRNILVLCYTTYVNTELDSGLDADKRREARGRWIQLVSAIQGISFKVRVVTTIASSAASSDDPDKFKAALEAAVALLDQNENDLKAALQSFTSGSGAIF